MGGVNYYTVKMVLTANRDSRDSGKQNNEHISGKIENFHCELLTFENKTFSENKIKAKQ